ncbi:MAG: DUF3990 domain-containing protein [Lachnospiraceae bacterium]|nr:DUF3990 domain-containing protein [Lachnospiraceae bacterium]
MIKKIYHGSDHVIQSPIFGAGKSYNDYGLGFYCTETLETAKEWGVSESKDGFANRYTIDCSDLNILNLNDPKYCILHWLAILLENRSFDVSSPLASQAKEYIIKNFDSDYKNADCIIGYRADDSYFSFASDFINGGISYRQLNNAMHLGKLGQQFVLKSKKSFNRINFIGYEIAKIDEWYPQKKLRNQKARNDYFSIEKNHFERNDLFITQILSEEMKRDDARLR